MPAAQNRLSNRHDIVKVARRGRSGAVGPLNIKAAPNQLPHSRVLVAVSKKVSKKAVVRNRIRRRLQGCLDSQWATVAPGYDIVLTVRDNIADASTGDLSQWVGGALNRVNLT
jgi:ribonuclease P protein component